MPLLQISDIIDKVDDLNLADSDQQNQWEHFMAEQPSSPSDTSMGWCMPETTFMGQIS